MHIKGYNKTFTYLGGKFSILPRLLPIINFPVNHRIDVFGGSGTVLINCDPAPIETYNDLNGRLVNFFRVLRDQPEELIALLQLTPHSYEEYKQAWYSETDTPVESARKFFVRCVQSIYAAGAQDKVKGWASALTESRVSISEKTHKWIRSVNNLYEVAERFKHIQIENRDFRFIMKNYNSSGTHFFCDSPYDNTLRSDTRYQFDFQHQDHYDLRYWAGKAKGYVTICGYDTEFMNELYKDFKKHSLGQRRNTRSKKNAIECVWTNY